MRTSRDKFITYDSAPQINHYKEQIRCTHFQSPWEGSFSIAHLCYFRYSNA